jgi:hypothetical protein
MATLKDLEVIQMYTVMILKANKSCHTSVMKAAFCIF